MRRHEKIITAQGLLKALSMVAPEDKIYVSFTDARLLHEIIEVSVKLPTVSEEDEYVVLEIFGKECD